MSTGVDFESLLRGLHGSLVSSGQVQAVTEQFSALDTDMERVQFLMKMPESGPLQQVTGGGPPRSAAASEQLRADGNACFGRGEHTAALRLYSQAAQCSPAGSPQLSLALANRSAALFQLGRYGPCEEAVQQALQHGYPREMRYKLHERLGEARRRQGDGAGAERAFCAALAAARSAPLDARRRKQLLVRLDGLVCRSAADRVKRLLETGQEGELQPEQTEHSDQNRERERTQKQGEQTEQRKDEQKQSSGTKRRREERKSPSPSVPQLPPLSHGPSEVVPAASAAVDLVVTQEKGRMLVANRDLSPGDVVIVEPALCSATLPDSWATHCYQCCARLQETVPCLSCSSVRFCSEACRTAAADQHVLECGLLERLLELDVGPMALLALRLVAAAGPERLRRQRLGRPGDTTGSGGEGCSPGQLDAARGLVGHTKQRSVADLFRRTATAVCLACLLYSQRGDSSTRIENSRNENGETTQRENGTSEQSSVREENDVSKEGSDLEETAAALLHYLQSLPCNAHEISEQVVRGEEAELREVGAAVYPSVSLLNHSCDPNVLRVSHGTACVVRVIQPVPAGGELLDNYGFHWAVQGWTERQAALRGQYFFDCRCRACTEDWAPHMDLPEKEYFLCDLCDAPPIYCYHEKDASKVEAFTRSRRAFMKAMERRKQRGGTADDVEALVNHMRVMQRVIAKPSREFNNCQEAVKLHFFAEGNSYQELAEKQPTAKSMLKEAGTTETLNCIERLYGKNKRITA
ncbi:SET and MYND domain-containing protein 4-like [Amphibalanus amphitrite]|uniref:SET and MYND domain-containing protein 4-like n=1 Tax=Amphibalanus amphitrite TaxID=1232801 RepID=UPI001C907311|nr:SET and MYND domain-containing protein 4-like [Amphibalanus amphitrite]XP_043240454.1 SET and MYND domain-containing protein 4-like [Amphibalanus amphitrite]